MIVGCCTMPKSSFPVGERDFIDNENNLDRFYKSTVMLIGMDLSGHIIPNCSGVFISKDLILTARHCVFDPEDFAIQNPKTKNKFFVPTAAVEKTIKNKVIPFISRKTYEANNTDLLSIHAIDVSFAEVKFIDIYSYKDDSKDIAILKVPVKEFESDSWLPISKSVIKRGKKVYALGNPLTLPWILTSGRVSQYLLLNDLAVYKETDFDKFFSFQQTRNKVYVFDLNAWPGLSGGPIINNSGEIISIVTITLSSDREGGGMTVGIMTDEINRELIDNKIIL